MMPSPNSAFPTSHPPPEKNSRSTTPSFPGASPASLHLDLHAHPGMDAALEKMSTLREIHDLEIAALENSGLGYRDLRKTASTLWNRLLTRRIEPWYKATAELLYLGEGVRLAALVGYGKDGSFLHGDNVRFEVPVRVGCSSGCLGKQVRQRRERSERNVLAEVRAKHGVEGGRIAFVQGHDLCDMWWLCCRCLGKHVRRA